MTKHTKKRKNKQNNKKAPNGPGGPINQWIVDKPIVDKSPQKKQGKPFSPKKQDDINDKNNRKTI
jgi:hypothetical protein